MEDGGNAAEGIALGDPDAELVAVEIVGDPPAGQIAVLLAVAEIVDDEMSLSPRSLRALIRLAPMKPAPPVTMNISEE